MHVYKRIIHDNDDEDDANTSFQFLFLEGEFFFPVYFIFFISSSRSDLYVQVCKMTKYVSTVLYFPFFSCSRPRLLVTK